MTRKRFIKLLMSQGVQRNDAEKYAREEINTISLNFKKRDTVK